MRNLLFTALALGAGALSVLAEDPRRIDVNNLFPSTGAYVIWVDPNNAGVPPGILALGTGTLIHERVFLTCGHCTRASEPGIPPFIRVFVTFNLHVSDDPSAWIPVVAQCTRQRCPAALITPATGPTSPSRDRISRTLG
jgi:hypothetical protein